MNYYRSVWISLISQPGIILLFLCILVSLGKPTNASAQEGGAEFAAKLDFEFITDRGVIKPPPEAFNWYANCDLRATYTLQNVTQTTHSDICLQYDLRGLFPKSLAMETSGTVTDITMDDRYLYIENMGPGAKLTVSLGFITALGPNLFDIIWIYNSGDGPTNEASCEPPVLGRSFSGIWGNIPNYDLEATITAAPTKTHLGGFAAYLISVTNHGPDPATGIQLESSRPLTYDLFRIDPQDDWWIWHQVAPLLPGQTAVYAYLDLVSPTDVPGEKLTTCSVTSDWPEYDESNNTAKLITPYAYEPNPATDLTLIPESIPTTGVDGQPLQFAYTITNDGSTDVKNGYVGFYVRQAGKIISAECESGTITITKLYAHIAGLNIKPGKSESVKFTVLPHEGYLDHYCGTASEVFDTNESNNYIAGQFWTNAAH